jgi:hypothetical protein
VKRLFASILLFAATAAGAAQPREHEMHVGGELVIGPAGEVREYTLDDGVKPVLARLVADNVARWRFEPVQVDGKAVTAKTRMSLRLAARELDGGDVELRVDDVDFGSYEKPRRWRMPVPPMEVLRNGVNARLIVVARLDAKGNVTDAHALQVNLSKDLRPEQYRKAYADTVVGAVRKWKYDPVEFLDDRAMGGTVTIPIEFVVSRGVSRKAPEPDAWRSYFPGPIVPAPWMTQAEALDAVGGTGQSDGAAVALESSFRLQSDVIGKTL